MINWLLSTFASLFGDAWLTLRNLGVTPPGARLAYQVEPAVTATPPDFLTSCLSHREDKAATDGHQLAYSFVGAVLLI